MKKAKTIKFFEIFYDKLPNTNFSYEAFTLLLNERIKILQKVEDNITNIEVLKMKNYDEDILSHFICKTVACQIEWTSNWFVNMETKLCKIKLNYFDLNQITLKISGCKKNKDIIVVGPYEDNNFETINIKSNLMIHFSRVSELLGTRNIIFKNGYASLPATKFKNLILNEFRYFLDKEMLRLKYLMLEYPDERLFKMCQSIFTNNLSSSLKNELNLFDNEKYFPPCIQQIIDIFKTKKHIKYNDRQTLSLFFKDLNVPIEQTINFFRSNFNISLNDFDKKYLYNIRHNYGLEGRKAVYMCFSCKTLETFKNSENKSCCPYVDNSDYVKRKFLNIDIEDLIDQKPTSKCSKVLEKLTKFKIDRLITTPVKYFETYKKFDIDN
ncbi:dna primase large subunit [Vairimorpha apis BRL 01]|uniref:Dna primase large subunit n=1 Tax=Vairimorpha apis BRL 01 TaxID=1037528 RepID=T0L9M0_9MICR|nr:dna primase large subunit [Vairimorpha apis BRL 01]